MSKRILIVNGSPRCDGTNARIAGMIAELAKKYGYETEIANICGMDIRGCRACMSCRSTGTCAQNDGMTRMYERIRGSDMLVLASPIYMGAESGQMKCFTDRFYAMTSGNGKEARADIGKVTKGSVLLTCGAVSGAMTYGGVLARMTKLLKGMGIDDLSGTIIAGQDPDGLSESESVKDYLDSIEFQLGM